MTKLFKVVGNRSEHCFELGSIIHYIGVDEAGHDMYRGYSEKADIVIRQWLMEEDVAPVEDDDQSPDEYIAGLVATLPREIGIRILMDVSHRMDDWYNSGGKASDDYIKQQVKYVEEAVKEYGGKKNEGKA